MSKRCNLSWNEKNELLKKYDLLPACSQRKAAAVLNISQPLLNKILRSRYEIEDAILENENTCRKRRRCGKDEEVERALKIWFESSKDDYEKITGSMLMKKAEDLARDLGKSNFKASQGWLYRWMKRENLNPTKKCKEEGD